MDTRDLVIEKLLIWQTKATALAQAVEEEMTLRKELAALAFPDPKEGVNNFPLNAGYILKVDHKINRKFTDEALLPTVAQQLAAVGASIDDYVKAKPTLIVGAFKDAMANETIGPILRSVVESSPGAPSLSIVLPKKAQK